MTILHNTVLGKVIIFACIAHLGLIFEIFLDNKKKKKLDNQNVW